MAGKIRSLLFLGLIFILYRKVASSNHHLPVIDNLPATIYLNEDDEDFAIFTVLYHDDQNDALDKPSMTKLDGGPFDINKDVIELKKNTNFDVTQRNNYTLQICVTEKKTKVNRRCENLYIYISRASPPYWNGNLDFTINVPEDELDGTRVYLVYAVDPDLDWLSYSHTASTGGGAAGFPFFFDNTTGGFYLNGSLDFETETQYTATFSATDSMFDPIFGTLTINVIDVNEPPVLLGCPVIVHVDENTQTIPGLPMTLFTVTTTDEDPADTVNLSLTCTNSTVCPIRINPTTGIVSLDSNLPGAVIDYEQIQQYVVTLTADDGVNQVTCKVPVNITDIEELPRITNLPARLYVHEHETQARELIHLEVFDDEIWNNPENKDNIEFFMGVYPTNQASFSIDRNKGIIWLEWNPDLNYEEVKEYELRVWITDGHKPPVQVGIATIEVLDENDPPNLRNVPKDIWVFEGMTTPSDVYVAYAEDEDVGDTITYTMGDVRPTIGGAQFTMDPTTGMITTVANPEFNWAFWPSYQMDIIATDNHGLTDTKTLTINVRNANKDPTFTVPPSTVVCDEEGTTGDNIATIPLAAWDPDITDTLTYTLTGFGSGKFQLDTSGTTPVLQYGANNIDYDTMNQPAAYFLNVRVDDGFGGQDFLPLNIIINNINDNTPSFPTATYTATFPEDSPAGMSVVAISAFDNDLDNHGEFTYAIDPTNGPALYHFEINPLDGILYLKNPIDYETRTTLNFDITATDTGGLTSTASVAVTITDVNDNVPYFIPAGIKVYNHEMPLDAKAGYTIGYVEAADNDAGSVVFTYALVDNDEGRYNINPGTGLITYIGTGNLTENTTYGVGATATDIASPNQVSSRIPVRIDAYLPCSTLYNIWIGAVSPASFTTQGGRDTFTALLGGAVPGAPARIAYIQDQPPHTYTGATTDGQIKVTVYFVEGDVTNNLWALHTVNKTYFPASKVDGILNAGEGVPTSKLTDALTGYIVEKVEPLDKDYCYPPVIVDWWLDTTEGRTLIAFLTMAGLALLCYLLYLLITKPPWYKLRCKKPNCCKKKPPKPKPQRPKTPRGTKKVHDFQYESNKVDKADPFTFRRGANRPKDLPPPKHIDMFQ